MLADAGYDSEKIENKLDSLNCDYIIPKNKRNKNSVEMKEEKKQIRKDGTKKIKKIKQQIGMRAYPL
jgi:hypothetical protein